MEMSYEFYTNAGANETMDQDLFPNSGNNLHHDIRTNETFLSDISDSACSQMMERNERNHDMIESPPAFLMNDNGPPSVIYNGAIGNSMSFYTTYSAAVTEAGTVMDHKYVACAQDLSVHLSVIDEGEEAGVEIDYENRSFSASQVSKHDGVGLDGDECKQEEAQCTSDEGEGTANPNDENGTSIPSLTTSEENGDKETISITVEDSDSKVSTSSRSKRKRSNTLKDGSVGFFNRSADDISKRSEGKDKESIEQIAEDTIEMAYSEGNNTSNIIENTTHETKVESNEAAVDEFELTYLENGEMPELQTDVQYFSDDNMEYGFEVRHGTSINIDQGIVAVATAVTAPSPELEKGVMTGSNAPHSLHTSADKPTSIETEPDNSNQWGMKPDKSLDFDDNSTVGSGALSYLTMDTKDLTDTSDNSTINDSFQPKSRKGHNWLFAKLFACGAATIGQCHSTHGEDREPENTPQVSEEEKIEQLTREYDALLERPEVECNDIDGALSKLLAEGGAVALAKSNSNDVTPIKSTVIAKTKLYPGFEIINKQGKHKVSTNSKSRAIDDMLKLLKGKKVSKSKKIARRPSENKGMQKSKKSVLERVNVQVL
jgi:hypothetical protein